MEAAVFSGREPAVCKEACDTSNIDTLKNRSSLSLWKWPAIVGKDRYIFLLSGDIKKKKKKKERRKKEKDEGRKQRV